MYNNIKYHFFHHLSVTHSLFILYSHTSSQSMLNLVFVSFPKGVEVKLLPPGKLLETSPEKNEEENIYRKIKVMGLFQGQSQKFHFVQEGKGGI